MCFFQGGHISKSVLQEFVGGFLKKMLFFELVLMVKRQQSRDDSFDLKGLEWIHLVEIPKMEVS